MFQLFKHVPMCVSSPLFTQTRHVNPCGAIFIIDKPSKVRYTPTTWSAG